MRTQEELAPQRVFVVGGPGPSGTIKGAWTRRGVVARGVSTSLSSGLLAAACGQAPTAPAEPAAAPAQGTVELTWLMSEDPKTSGMEEVAEAYNTSQQRATVTILPTGGNYEDKLRTMLAAGTVPEVARLNDDLLASYACRGNCRPMEEFLTRQKVKKEEFFPNQWRLPVYQNKTYAMIAGYQPQVIWVNVDLFKQAGLKVPTVPYKSNEWTWDEYVTTAKHLTSRQMGADGQPLTFGTNVLHSWYGYWVHGHGGEVLTPDLKKFGLALPSGSDALQWVADLIHKHRVHPPLAYTRQSGNSASNLFVNGRLAMLAGGGNWNTYRTQIKSFEWDIVPYPKGKVRRGHTATPLLFMIPTGTKFPEQGFSFLLHLVSDDAQKIIAAKGFRMPPKKAQANSSLWLRPELPPKNQKLWVEAMDGAQWEPQIPQREKL
ncbi:MAG TPA: extracellular solute-binding protein, partial [Chloroflexota bacterium]|nr:extracellular solute-binding protein [Chloroflexota bacterium]